MPSNPMTFLAPLNGSLAYSSRSGPGTLTGAGAIRYFPASGATTNWFYDPEFSGSNSGFSGYDNAGPLTFTLDTSEYRSGPQSMKVSKTSSGSASTLRWSGRINNDSVIGISPGMTLTISCWVKCSVAGAIRIVVINVGTSTTTWIGAWNAGTSWERISLSYTVPSTAQQSDIKLEFSSGASTSYVDDMMIQHGSISDFVSPTVWVNPRSGILGTTYSSPNVSLSSVYIEEATTNQVQDPSFENATITTHWAAQGTGAIARTGAYSYLGGNSAEVTCNAAGTDGIFIAAGKTPAAASGQTWSMSCYVRAKSSSDVGKLIRLDISERTSADALVASNVGADVALTDIWQRITLTATLSGGGTVAKVNGNINAATSPGAVPFTFLVDCIQLEQKAYHTTYTDGSLGTGYSWAGTANASASTRTVGQLSVATSNSIFNHNSASVAMKANRETDSGILQRLFDSGHTGGGAGQDRVTGQYASSDIPQTIWLSNSASTSSAHATAQGSGMWEDIYFDWGGSDHYVIIDGTSSTPGAIASRTGVGSGNIYIGGTAGSNVWNGKIGPVAIFSRSLTAAERAKLIALSVWRFTMFKKNNRHVKLT